MPLAPVHQCILHPPAALRAAPALIWHGGVISRAELRGRVLALGGLMRRLGGDRGERVALCLPRGPAAVELAFAALAQGMVCVPLDPGTPLARLLRLLAAVEPVIVFALPRLADDLAAATLGGPPRRIVPVEGDRPVDLVTGSSPAAPAPTEPQIESVDTALVLFTSGSTGVPKGIELSHANVSAFVDWSIRQFALNARDRFVSLSPLSFDLALLEVFASQQVGASVYLTSNREATFPAVVARILEAQRITVWYSVPLALRLLHERGDLGARSLDALRLVLFAGEVFPVPALRRLMQDLPGPEYYNLYGPTETNVCTVHRVSMPGVDDDAIPIGRPCDHLEVRICAADGSPLGPGETGEICVWGPSVMRGYWRADGATRASRVGGREDSYRTADLGTVDDRGRIWFRGRRDHQVKVRGHRIELLEIERLLLARDDVREAVVTVAGAGTIEATLVAHVVPSAHLALDPHTVRGHLADRLPRHSVPGHFVVREAMPYTSTRKVDRQALAELGEATAAAQGTMTGKADE